MRNTIIIALISLVVISCGKDKFTTKPQLTFKKVNNDVFGTGQIMEFTLGFTDSEGDFPGKVYIQRVTPGCAADTSFKVIYDMPEFPTSSNFEGDLKIIYNLGSNDGQTPIMLLPPEECGDTSSCYLRFAIEDKAGNKSDTINSSTIILINN